MTLERDGGRGDFGVSAAGCLALEARRNLGCGRRIASGLRADRAALRFLVLKFPHRPRIARRG
jgi:hypothetical protein